MSNITEIQRLLNEKADLQAQINISAFDGSIEVKTVNDQKYIYVRKREAGKYKSNYIDKYSEELYALAVNQSQQIRAVKKQLANHFMIGKGIGLLVVPENIVPEFKSLLVAYYEGRNEDEIKAFLKEKCWRKF